MKVSLITRHWVANYGSFLQTLATQWAVESLGHMCETIDYVRGDESLFQLEQTLLKSKPNWNRPLPKKLAYLAMRQPESIISRLVFERRLRSGIKLSRRYQSLKSLKAEPPIADVYMTGSDQVWGPMASGEYDPAYLLVFAPDNARKIAYAASFGKGSLDTKTEALFRKELPSYDAIAVREDSARGRVRSFGVDAKQVLDPTLLWTADRWNMFAGPRTSERYVLVYQIHNDDRVTACARGAACMLGLPLVRTSPTLHQFPKGGRFRYLPSPEEFLGLIRDAVCVVTDSFHGTAFSITFNTPFFEVLPLNGTSERNESLLRLTGLEGRAVRTPQDVEKAGFEVDFSCANDELAEDRIRSMAILKGMIEGC